MRNVLIVLALFCGSVFAQNGGVIPPPDIANAAGQIANAGNRAQGQAAQTALIKQQTALLKQQTEALKQQNELLKEQQQAALLVAPKQFVSSAAVRKPRIDDIDAATGKPRFANYAEFEDGKDEWLIEEALRRFEALHPAAPAKQ